MKTKGEKVYTSFELQAPSAEEVVICGDFTEWESKARRLRRLKSGLWKATLKLPRGDHQYRFKVDGMWLNDPSSSGQIDNGMGGLNSIVTVE